MTRERLVALVALVNLAAAAVHSVAHGALRLFPGGTADGLFVLAVVYVGPILALWMLRRRQPFPAGLVLSTSMAAALAYGIVFHYVLATPDHVSQAPAVMWGALFRVTAAALVPLEAAGLVAGALLLVGAPLPRARLSDNR